MKKKLLRNIAVSTAGMAMVLGAFLSTSPVAAGASPATAHPKVMERISSTTHRTAARGIVTQPPMAYHGGTDGIGVNVGAPKVYLVFWGSQWGQASTTGSGYLKLSNDPSNMAVMLQRFFAGLGTNSEGWSKVLSQYCQAPLLLFTIDCARVVGALHIPVPVNGVLGGVWYDNAGAQATRRATCTDGARHSCQTGPSANKIASEALRAETHFGLTSASANRNAQFVIVSPPGSSPDGFNQFLANGTGDFCAWHDYTGSAAYSSARANNPGTSAVAFTNLPYIPDAGGSCGANYVRNARDGITIVASHEYAETVTDQFPEVLTGGWFDLTTGNEVGDACSWGAGPGDGAGLVALATGTFPLESSWSNIAGACVLQSQ